MANPIYEHLKRRLYARYNHGIDTPLDRRRSAFFTEVFDVGFLRHWWTNDGEIAPGVYRSNHPNEKRFKAYAEQGIKTVLNLRNDVERAPSKFARERTLANGMTYVSYPLFPRRAPTRDELLGLIDLFPTLEKPILIHCKSGADRTGLAGAIWRLTQEGEPLAVARQELSLKYIHRRDSETGVLDEILDEYAFFETEMSFRDWVANRYDPAEANRKAKESKPQRGFWARLKYFYRDVYTYAQFREARWHNSFAKEIRTETDRKRATFFMRWIDHEILRVYWHNFHKVDDGVFRSNHPTEKRFRKYAAQGFKTVVNLRGASMQPQYQLEKVLCAELGMTLIDIPMSGSAAPPRDILLALLDSFDTAQTPMILHCKSGADRTGLAAALYCLYKGGTPDQARRHLRLRYLHLRNGSKGVLDWVIDQYEAETAIQPLSLREWITTKYDPESLTKGFHALRKHGQFPALPAPGSGQHGQRLRKIAVVTSVRNDAFFLHRWIDYYGAAFGPASLFVILDGFDQPLPDAKGVNVIRVPHRKRSVVAGDKARAKRASDLAETLFRSFDIVIGTDVDEFIVVDPNTDQTLAEYLSAQTLTGPLSGLGLDVAQHLTREGPIQPDQPFLAQRHFAKISDRYTKASILNAPLRWGSGYHRVKGQNFTIDPNLFLFHFGSVDQGISAGRATDQNRIDEGWTSHQQRRDTLFQEITKATPLPGDERFASARAEMSENRPWYAWNKPGALEKDAIIEIPARFRDVV